MNIGDVVGGFVIEGVLAHGGTSTVYRARRAGRELVALKVEAAARSSEVTAKRLEREARILDEVRHPRLARAIAHGWDPRHRVWFVATTLVPGEPLAARLERLGSLEWSEVSRIVDDIAGALGALHAHGVVHRDVSPGNIVLVTDERDQVLEARLVDLGLGLGEGDEPLTTTGRLYGTLPYVPPERLASPRDQATAAGDQWALASVAHDALTGARAWSDVGTLEIARRCVSGTERGSLPPSVPRDARRALARARSVDPFARYETVERLADALAMRRPVGWLRPAVRATGGTLVTLLALVVAIGGPVGAAVALVTVAQWLGS